MVVRSVSPSSHYSVTPGLAVPLAQTACVRRSLGGDTNLTGGQQWMAKGSEVTQGWCSVLLCSGAAWTWKQESACTHQSPWHHLDILRPSGSRLTSVVFIYSAANVWDLVRNGGWWKCKTRPWLFFPSSLKLASSNNLQCALQQSRNQAGHRPLLPLSSSHRNRIPSLYPQSFFLPFTPLPQLDFPVASNGGACCSWRSGERDWESWNYLKLRSSGKPCLPGVERLRPTIQLLSHEESWFLLKRNGERLKA